MRLFTNSDRPSERVLDGPFRLVQPRDESVHVDAEIFCPCEERFRFSAKRQQSVVGAVAAVLFGRDPLHISRLVIAVVVDSMKLIFRAGGGANVSKKILKAISPSLANRYSATAIATKAPLRRAFATVNHRQPRVVFLRRLVAPRLPVFPVIKYSRHSHILHQTLLEVN
jgi:hypothetical protein